MFFSWRRRSVTSGARALSAPQFAMEEFPTGEPKKKILLVDDDAVVVAALSMKLKANGYQVLAAKDGSEALVAIRREKPDLMLLDIHFPPDVGTVDWNGFRIAQWVRRMNSAERVPIIAISGSDRLEHKQKAKEEGILALLKKPVDSQLLLASVNLALCRKSSREPVRATADSAI